MKKSSKNWQVARTIGLDLGDRWTRYCMLDGEGEVIAEGRMATTPAGVSEFLGKVPRCRVAMEVGSASPWVSRLAESDGHEVLVANARQVKLIYAGDRKSDRVDAEQLARLARLDPKLLRPIEHRGLEAQQDLATLRSRDVLVRSRTQLISHARGLVKSIGERLPSCSAEAFAHRVEGALPATLRQGLEPVVEMVAALTAQIRSLDRRIEELARERYPEAARVRQVPGVGAITSLAFVLILEDPGRFAKSRQVGPYVGLVPREHQSGDRQAQLRITKAGDAFLRRLLVQSAQYILGAHGPDCELRRFGFRLAERGGKNGKKRAVIAVARKLAILLHRLWVSGATYDPHYQQVPSQAA